MTVSRIENTLAGLGISLPEAPKPIAQYVPAKRIGDMIYVSGQGPIRNGVPTCVGRVGADVTTEQGYEAAQLCILNGLAAIKQVVGSLDCISQIVSIRGFVNSANAFFDQPQVINGASDLLVRAFGDRGQHARAALGTSVLPGNISVEIEMIVSVSETPDKSCQG